MASLPAGGVRALREATFHAHDLAHFLLLAVEGWGHGSSPMPGRALRMKRDLIVRIMVGRSQENCAPKWSQIWALLD